MTADLRKRLVIRDEVHGDLQFDSVLRGVIDHPYFQRLRLIKQLGLAEFVFPCATHTRFQHSLGASYLAGEYYGQFLRSWLVSNVKLQAVSGSTHVDSDSTIDCVHRVSEHTSSHEFWGRVVRLSGLLHDIGHGPWSHTFEVLNITQDFSSVIEKMDGVVKKYLESQKGPLFHEDIGLLYLFRIFDDLQKSKTVPRAMDYYLPVCALINRKLSAGQWKDQVQAELVEHLSELGVKGGLAFHRLMSPLISGPFDVDRMDYIQRDGRNCGVSIGGIEWRRIVGRVMPCLAEHPNSKGEPGDIVLLSGIKNQHVLDDFVFSLFQMYTQVYLHPKIVGLEESIKKVLREANTEGAVVDFETHASLSDEGFRVFLRDRLKTEQVERLLLRKQGSTFRVKSFPSDFSQAKDLQAHGYSQMSELDRPMMKDIVGVYLICPMPGSTDSGETQLLLPWEEVSPVASRFYSVKYAPQMWLRAQMKV